MTQISFDLLKLQNAQTSTAVIELLESNSSFVKLSQYEGHLTVTRDNEDAEKLQKGIDFAKSKQVIDPNFTPEPYVEIDVLGKTPDQVASTILEKSSDAKVIVIVGLSGTGKGTTVSKLREKLTSQGKPVVTWSNGNIFRSVTLLAATYCETNQIDNVKEALTKENISNFMSMLKFAKHPTKHVYDTHIDGLGLDLWVSDVQNTDLKQPKVSKNIPTVAEFTQGEVILFAALAVQKMGDDGLVVLLEGREQTVNYVRSPHRFTLVLSDDSLIGKRRAAQRLMAGALGSCSSSTEEEVTPEQVETALTSCLTGMVKDAGL